MRAEVGRCLISMTEGDDELVATFSFPEDFIGFAGHFPDNPVLPGVCAIEAALVILEAHFRKRVVLRRVTSAKFLAVVKCAQECTWTCRVRDMGDGAYRVKTMIHRENERIATLDLMVALLDEAAT